MSGIPCTQGRMKLNIGGVEELNGSAIKTKAASLRPSWESMYKMTSDPRGLCLIINNRYFTGKFITILSSCTCSCPLQVNLQFRVTCYTSCSIIMQYQYNLLETGHLKERLGTDVDRDNLYMLFSQLGYNICVQENLTGMVSITLHVQRLFNADCFFHFVTSHTHKFIGMQDRVCSHTIPKVFVGENQLYFLHKKIDCFESLYNF